MNFSCKEATILAASKLHSTKIGVIGTLSRPTLRHMGKLGLSSTMLNLAGVPRVNLASAMLSPTGVPRVILI
jgi:hypothetical protein